jgi:hypothetical protein
VELLIHVVSLHVEEHETKEGAMDLTFAASKRQTRIVDIFLKIRLRIVQYRKEIILALRRL